MQQEKKESSCSDYLRITTITMRHSLRVDGVKTTRPRVLAVSNRDLAGEYLAKRVDWDSADLAWVCVMFGYVWCIRFNSLVPMNGLHLNQ